MSQERKYNLKKQTVETNIYSWIALVTRAWKEKQGGLQQTAVCTDAHIQQGPHTAEEGD